MILSSDGSKLLQGGSLGPSQLDIVRSRYLSLHFVCCGLSSANLFMFEIVLGWVRLG